MNKFLWTFGTWALGALALSACSSHQHTDKGANKSAMTEGSPDFVVGRMYLSVDGGDYAPVNDGRVPAQAPTVAVEPVSKTLSIRGDGSLGTFTVAVPRVMRWTERVPVTRTRWVNKSFVEPGWCDSYECLNEAGGQSPLWDAFYSARKEDKPRALAAAIKGVGESSATKLVAAGYFHRKPRTWSAFAAEIERAEDAGVIDPNVRYQALVTYRLDNLVALGYAESSCRVVQRRCNVVVTRLVEEQYQDWEDQQRSRILDTVVRDFEITVTGSALQSFETDSVTITAGQQPDDLRVSAGSHTRYNYSVSHEGRKTRISLVGLERIPVDLPQSALVSGVLQPGAVPTLQVVVDRRYLPAGGDDQLVLSYKVMGCKMGAMDKCWGSGEKKLLDQGIVPVTGEGTSVSLTRVPRGHKVDVRYSIARRNSRYYNDSWIQERVTDEIKVK